MPPPNILTICTGCSAPLPGCTCGAYAYAGYVALADVSHEEQERWKAENLDLNTAENQAREGAGVSDPPPLPSAPPEAGPATDVEGNELPPELAEALARGEFPK